MTVTIDSPRYTPGGSTTMVTSPVTRPHLQHRRVWPIKGPKPYWLWPPWVGAAVPSQSALARSPWKSGHRSGLQPHAQGRHPQSGLSSCPVLVVRSWVCVKRILLMAVWYCGLHGPYWHAPAQTPNPSSASGYLTMESRRCATRRSWWDNSLHLGHWTSWSVPSLSRSSGSMRIGQMLL